MWFRSATNSLYSEYQLFLKPAKPRKKCDGGRNLFTIATKTVDALRINLVRKAQEIL